MGNTRTLELDDDSSLTEEQIAFMKKKGASLTDVGSWESIRDLGEFVVLFMLYRQAVFVELLLAENEGIAKEDALLVQAAWHDASEIFHEKFYRETKDTHDKSLSEILGTLFVTD